MAKTSAAGVPTERPSAIDIYEFSRDAIRYNLGTVLLLWLLSIVVSGSFDRLFATAGSLAGFIVNALITVAFTFATIAGVRRKKLDVNKAFGDSLNLWLKMIGLSILVIAALTVSLLLLIIPFFFVLPRLTLSTYYLVDKNMGITEAFQASWDATKGYSLLIWGIILVNIGMALLFITIIGIPLAIYLLFMYSAAFAVLYEYVSKQPTKAE